MPDFRLCVFKQRPVLLLSDNFQVTILIDLQLDFCNCRLSKFLAFRTYRIDEAIPYWCQTMSQIREVQKQQAACIPFFLFLFSISSHNNKKQQNYKTTKSAKVANSLHSIFLFQFPIYTSPTDWAEERKRKCFQKHNSRLKGRLLC